MYGINLATFQMENAAPYLTYLPTIFIDFIELIKQREIFMVPIYKQRCEGFIVEPLSPIHLFFGVVPNTAEVPAYYHNVFFCEDFLLAKIRS